ncbi:MAG TPA: hypothetical protein VGB88_03100 [Alphaproteobacteria bacterium]
MGLASPTLTLFEDRLAPGAVLGPAPAAGHRVIYVAEGAATVDGAAAAEDEARYGAADASIAAGRSGAVLWRWQVADGDVPAGAGSTGKLAVALARHGIGRGRWLLRCDSVWFPPGGCAYLHTHRGPGIRCLRTGSIRIDTAGTSTRYRPGEAWFEPGPEPVFAQGDAEHETRFIRVMVLPPALAGQPSITYVRSEDRDRPKSQRYRGYCDIPVDL